MCAVELLARTVGMDDDAGKAAATSSADLPAADFTGMRHIFPGNRSNVKWAAFGENGEVGMIALESGTGNVSFENISGRIYLTENMAVAGYEGGMTMKHIAMLFALIGKQ